MHVNKLNWLHCNLSFPSVICKMCILCVCNFLNSNNFVNKFTLKQQIKLCANFEPYLCKSVSCWQKGDFPKLSDLLWNTAAPNICHLWMLAVLWEQCCSYKNILHLCPWALHNYYHSCQIHQSWVCGFIHISHCIFPCVTVDILISSWMEQNK